MQQHIELDDADSRDFWLNELEKHVRSVGITLGLWYPHGCLIPDATTPPALDQWQTASRRDDDVARPLLQRMAEGAVPDNGVGEVQDLRRHGPSFGSVAVEEPAGGPARNDQGELPCQVVRVHDPGVHALTACRSVDVHGVAGEQHAAAAVGTR